MTDQTEPADPIGDTTPKTAHALLWRHGLPEDIIDGALALHAQELAALQRKAHDERRPYFHMGQPCTPGFGCHVGELIGLIDPTTDTAPAPAGVAPATDQTERRDRIADSVIPLLLDTLPKVIARARGYEVAEAVLAVLPDTSRATVLREAADAVAALREETCTNVVVYPVYDGGQRLALSNAETKLRRLAGEAQPEAPWATDGARIGRALIWSHTEAGKGEFGRGYRAAQEEVRSILTRPLLTAAQAQETTRAVPVQHAPGKAIRCADCRAKGYTVCMDEPQRAADSGDRIVGYSSPHGMFLYCTRHNDELGTTWPPVTADDLPEGGLCAKCGTDLLIPQADNR